jgi:GntR family transcriptional regulator, transcriptional repressor for pyruvate dehydrogenase complex
MSEFKGAGRRVQLPDLIASEMMNRIAEREYGPGTRLPTETALAASFGVSRNVVREAIARLRSDGLIETRQGRGAVVRHPSERETFRVDLVALEERGNLLDLYELRGLLEIQSAGLAALRRDEDDIATMEATIASMRGATGFDEERLNADAEFHRSLGRATGNHYLAMIVDYLASRIKDTTIATGRAHRQEDLIAVTLAEHQAILRAVRAGDAAAARAAMDAHIRGAARRLGVGLDARLPG